MEEIHKGLMHTIVGKMYVKAPVNSNMMTTTVTVSLITPLSAAAAPRSA